MECAGVPMADRTFSDDAPLSDFAVRRRRLLLATGAITLTGALAPRLLAGPREQVAADRSASRPVDRRAAPHRAATPPAPAYPLDRPLYYVDDAFRSIALTIDDGPDPVYTPQVLQVLESYGVTATFSMIGLHVAAYPQLAQAVAEAGHQIANHTWNHVNLAGMPAHRVHSEIELASQVIHEAIGMQPGLFRAPYGAWSPAVIRQCERMRMVPLDWSVDPRDWAQPGTSSIIRTIMRTTQPGSIILEHDGGGNRSETVAALRVVLPRLLREGYHFVTP
jgi:peptidoglycan/xylan/chitin deacetylase (PgdA/CDA1 family)